MTEHTETKELLYTRSVSTLRAHAIVSIVFGILGVVLGGLIFLLLLIGLGADTTTTSEDALFIFIYGIFLFIFGFVPHIFLIISGAQLLKLPRPGLVKGLTITNLIIGAFWNVPILVLAIINLVQVGDYERGYKHHKQ